MRATLNVLGTRPLIIAVCGGVVTLAILLLAIELTDVLITVLLAIVFSEAIRPGSLAMERRGLPRPVTLAVIYTGVFALVIGSVAVIAPPLTSQVLSLIGAIPEYLARLEVLFPGLRDAVAALGLEGALGNAMQGSDPLAILRPVIAVPISLMGGMISVVSGFALAAYWLGFTEIAERALDSRLSRGQVHFLRAVSRDISAVWGGWLRGQLMLMVFVGVLSFVGLVVLRVPYPLALAGFAGLTEILPIVGPWIGGVPAVFLATLQDPLLGLAVFFLYVLIQQVENNILVPRVMQQAVGVHPFLVLVSLLAGGALLGLPGVLLSVPVAGATQVIVTNLWPRSVTPVGAAGSPGPADDTPIAA